MSGPPLGGPFVDPAPLRRTPSMSTTPEPSAPRARRHAPRPVRAFVRDAAGASMAEYARMIGAVALIGGVGAKRLGGSINTGGGWIAHVIRTA